MSFATTDASSRVPSPSKPCPNFLTRAPILSNPFLGFYLIPEGRDEMFNQIASKTEDIKKAKKDMTTSCWECAQSKSEDVPLRLCSGCKLVLYCSRECQRKNWSSHKASCTIDPLDTKSAKFIKNLMANDLLKHYIETALVLQFDLHSSPQSDQALFARVETQLMPSDILSYMTDDKRNPEEKVQANLWVESITADKDRTYTIRSQHMEAWQRTRAMARTDTSREYGDDAPVVIVEFFRRLSKSSVFFFLPIAKSSFQKAKEAIPMTLITAMWGESQVPLSTEACIDGINSHILADKKNVLLLRASFRMADMQRESNKVDVE